MKETLGKEFYESADKAITISRPETLEDYLQRLKDRRTEDDYKYTDEDFIQYEEYITDCWLTNLSVYKCLEFMYFAEKEIKAEDVFNDQKKEGLKEFIDKHKQETLEEAAKRLYPKDSIWGMDLNEDSRNAMLMGAKWHAERSYSDEDMNKYADYVLMCSAEKTFKLPLQPKEWFEQFKKK